MNIQHNVKIGELNFELKIPEDPEAMPAFEIENDASMVYETVDVKEAIQLRGLLNEYIERAADS